MARACAGSAAEPAITGRGGLLADHRYGVIPAGLSTLRRMAKKTPADASPVADFEQSLDALESLVEKMEQGQMSLEDSLAAYERGVGLYRHCQQALEQAELRVRLLTDAEKPEQSTPFDDAADAP